MSGGKVFLICDQYDQTLQAKQQLQSQGFECQTFSFQEWRTQLSQPEFLGVLNFGAPSLVTGLQPLDGKNNVLQFPSGSSATSSRVATMEEMESKAIETAIQQYRGNLTEAAKALGIGRATLYRKVKLYNIDPNQSRRRRAA